MTYFGVKLRIYPNVSQTIQIECSLDNAKALWNKMLEMQIDRHNNNPKAPFINAYGMNNLLKSLKRDCEWLKVSDATSLQNVNKELETAYKNFFNHTAKFPRFKSRKRSVMTYTSTCVSNNIHISNNLIRLPKLGYVQFKSGGIPSGNIKAVTIKRSASHKYYAILRIKGDKQVFEKTHKTVGVDVGVASLATLSNGMKYHTVRFDKQLEKKKLIWQRKLARRRKLAIKDIAFKKHNKQSTKDILQYSNYMKARIMVAKYSEKERNRRTDYLQKITTQLVRDYDVIAIEDLKTSNMLKNHNLSRAISNASWNEFKNMLAYKCDWYGKQLVLVNPYKTSQVCSNCGYDDGKHALDVRSWTCPQCGTTLDRDVNAAVNIERLGLGQTLVI